MTFIDNFSKLNMGNFMSGWNNWFSPTFSCDFMPSFFDLNIFSSGFNNWSFPSFGNFNMPSLFDFGQTFNFNNAFSNNIWDNTEWNNTIFSAPTFNTYNSNIGDCFNFTNKNKAKFSMEEYNAQAGERLAKIALRRAPGRKEACAQYVREAVERAGLNACRAESAYQLIDLYRKNKDFKEISAKSVDVNSLPAGCIIIFKKGSQGYSLKHGHVEITTGDGRGVSDGITTKLKKPDAIFVPV